jgi:hypothetical protein
MSALNAIFTPASSELAAELEAKVIGQVSTYEGLAAIRRTGLAPDHFNDPANAVFFERVCQLDEPDALTAVLELSDDGKIDRGTASRLLDLCRNAEPSIQAATYARELIAASNSLKAEALSHRAELFIKDAKRAKAIELLQEAEEISSGGAQGLDRFDRYRFKADTPPSENIPTLFLDGIPVCNRGNISSLVSHKKMGKSRVARSILRAICSGGEHLGFTAPAGRVAYLDFEQSRADFHSLMAGVAERKEGRLLAYSMAGAAITEGRALVDLLARQDDLRAIVLDGWADLVADVNDPEESNEFVRWSMNLAARYDISILGLLHLNPGSETKSRGHLGSQLERKCETQLEIQAAGDERIICAPVARHRPIPKDHGIRIAWDIEANDFVRVEGTLADMKQAEKVEDLTRLLTDVQADTDMLGWRYCELVPAIMKADQVKDRAARNRIKNMLEAEILRHNGNTGIYTSNLSNGTS